MLPVCLDSKKDTLHPTIHDTIRQNLIFNLSQRRNINHAALQSSFYFRFFIRRQESHTIDYSEFIRRPPLGLSLASFDASRSFWPLFSFFPSVLDAWSGLSHVLSPFRSSLWLSVGTCPVCLEEQTVSNRAIYKHYRADITCIFSFPLRKFNC